MKAIKRNLLVAVVLLGTLVNYANVDENFKNTKLIKVVFENVQKNHDLVVKNSEGVVLHKENISKDGYLVKFFDFSYLNDGEYTVEVNKDYEILIKSFKVENSKVVVSKNVEKTIFKPVIKTIDNHIQISRINFDKSALNISIYYKNNIIVEEVVKSDDKLVNKLYKLDDTIKGNYRVIVSNNNKSYTKEFTL